MAEEDFNFDDETFGGDSEFGDDNEFDNDNDEELYSDDEPSEEVPSQEKEARVKARDQAREDAGWKIPKYQDFVNELEKLGENRPSQVKAYKALKAEDKEKSAEALEIRTQLAKFKKLNDQLTQIDKHINSIMSNPTSFDNIINFGSDVSQILGDMADKLIEAELRSDDKFNVFKGSVSQAKAVMEDKDLTFALNTLKDAGSSLGDKAVSAGVEVAEVGTNLVKKTFNGLFGSKKDAAAKVKAKDVEKENALLNILPAKHQEIKNAAKDIMGLEKSLITSLKDLNDLGNANLEAIKSLILYISAGDEIIRIYDEELIPKLIERKRTEGSAEANAQLMAFEDARSDFMDQLIELEQTMYSARVDVITLGMRINTNKEHIKKARRIRKNGINQMIKTLAFAVTEGKNVMRSRALMDMDDMGNELTDTTIALQQASQKTYKALSESGVNKINKFLEDQKIISDIMQENVDIAVNKNVKQLEAREKLEKGMAELADIKTKGTKSLADSREKTRKTLGSSSPRITETSANDDKSNDFASDLVAAAQKKRQAPRGPKQ